jgi:superfamily I DNA/RNA helicase
MEGTVDEERRLLYVGITRARQTLVLTWCHNRIKYGSVAPCTVSSFVREFDPAWVVHRELKQIMNAPVPAATVQNRFDQMKALLSK